MFGRDKENIADTVQETLDEVAAGLREARKRIRAAGYGTADDFRRSTRTTLRTSEDAVDTANDYVREYPVLAAGVAAAAAALVACLIFSRR